MILAAMRQLKWLQRRLWWDFYLWAHALRDAYADLYQLNREAARKRSQESSNYTSGDQDEHVF